MEYENYLSFKKRRDYWRDANKRLGDELEILNRLKISRKDKASLFRRFASRNENIDFDLFWIADCIYNGEEFFIELGPETEDEWAFYDEIIEDYGFSNN